MTYRCPVEAALCSVGTLLNTFCYAFSSCLSGQKINRSEWVMTELVDIKVSLKT